MRMPRLIASDLDGTLLQKGALTLSDQAMDLIGEILDRGILFVPASGRQYANLQNLFGRHRDRLSYICENGCLSFDRGRMISREEMDRDLGEELLAAIWEKEGCEILLSGIHTSYLQPKEASYVTHMREVVKNHVTIVEDIFSVREPYFKISIYEKGGLFDIPYWEDRFGDRCNVVTGGNAWLDIMPKGVHKALAMKKLLARLQIDPEDVMAFGDNYNDREMLELAGCPIAVSNARPEILAMSRYRTQSVEAALERLLRGEGFDW